MAVFWAKFFGFYGALMNFFQLCVKQGNMVYGQFEAAAGGRGED